jgi:hypothetical protein
MARAEEGCASLCYGVACAELDVGSCEICGDAVNNRFEGLGPASVLKSWSASGHKDGSDAGESCATHIHKHLFLVERWEGGSRRSHIETCVTHYESFRLLLPSNERRLLCDGSYTRRCKFDIDTGH